MTKLYANTRSGGIIQVDISSDIFEKYGVLPGAVCIRKDAKISNKLLIAVVVGTFGNELWFALQEKESYKLSYWNDIRDQDSFNKSFLITKNSYSVFELINMISQPTSEKIKQLEMTRKAIDVLVNSKWLHNRPAPELTPEEQKFQTEYENSVAKRQKVSWPGKKEMQEKILDFIKPSFQL